MRRRSRRSSGSTRSTSTASRNDRPRRVSECLEEKHGLHVFEDHFLPEIIDPVTEKRSARQAGNSSHNPDQGGVPRDPVPHEDISRLITKPCTCGAPTCGWRGSPGARTTCSSSGRHVFPFPDRVVLIAVEGVEPHYQLVVTREESLDVLEVQVEVNEDLHGRGEGLEESPPGGARHQGPARRPCKVKLVEPKSIQRSEGKPSASSTCGRSETQGGAMKVEQISVFLENKSGRLAEVTGILARRGSTSAPCPSPNGGLRDPAAHRDRTDQANKVLKETGFTVAKTEVIALECRTSPAGWPGSSRSDAAGSTWSTCTPSPAIGGQGDRHLPLRRARQGHPGAPDAGVRVLKGEEVYAL